jgi:hypothetical protein
MSNCNSLYNVNESGTYRSHCSLKQWSATRNSGIEILRNKTCNFQKYLKFVPVSVKAEPEYQVTQHNKIDDHVY